MLVSSHLLGEMSLLAQDLVVIGRGRLISQSSVDDFVRRNATRVGAGAQPAAAGVDRGARAAAAPSVERVDGADAIDVHDLAIEQIGETAAAAQITLHELATKTESLEDAFLSATADSQEYRSGGPS